MLRVKSLWGEFLRDRICNVPPYIRLFKEIYDSLEAWGCYWKQDPQFHIFLYKNKDNNKDLCYIIGKQHKGRDVSRLIVNPAKYFLFSRQVHLPGK